MKLYEYILQAKDQFSSTFNKLSAAAGMGESKVNRVSKSLNDAAREGNSLNGVFGGLGVTIARAFTIGSIVALTGSIFSAGAQAEQTRISYEVLLGSAEKASVKIQELQKFADVTPFKTQETFDAGQKLLAFGVKAESLIPIMKQLGDVSQGQSEKFKSITDNYGKLVSAQRANTIDLNQFAIAGVPVWDELGKIIGKTGKDLRKYVEDNGVSVDIINQILGNLTSEGGRFFGMMDKQSQSTTGKWSTFVSYLENTGKKIFNFVQPAINALIDLGTAFIKNEALLKNIGITIGIVGGAFLAYQTVVLVTNGILWAYGAATTAARLATILFTGGFAKLNLVMAMNPVGLIVAGVVALIGVFLVAYQKLDWFRGGLWGLWEAGKQVFMNLWNVGKQYLGGLGDLLMGILTLDVERIKKGLGNTFNGLKSAYTDTGKGVGAAFANGYEDGVKNKKINLDALLGTSKGSNPALAAASGDYGMVNGSAAKAAGFDLDSIQGLKAAIKELTSKRDKLTDKDQIGVANRQLLEYEKKLKSLKGEGKEESYDGIDAITAGGKKAVNIQINGVKFAENVKIMVENVDEAVEDIEGKFKEMFARVLNGAIYTTSQ